MNLCNFARCISGIFQFIRQICKGTNKGSRHLIQCKSVRFVFFQLFCVARFLRTEIPNKRSRIPGRFHRLTQRLHRLSGFLQPFFGLLQPVLQQPGHIRTVIPVKGTARIIAHRPFQALEQVFVINNIPVFLIFPVKAVHTAYRLEQPMVLHLFVYVKIGSRWRINPRQQLVHHNQQFHLPRLIHKFLAHLPLKFFRFGYGCFRRFIKPCRHHLLIGFILFQFLRIPFAAVFPLQIRRRRSI